MAPTSSRLTAIALALMFCLPTAALTALPTSPPASRPVPGPTAAGLGHGLGIEPLSITPDPTVDRFSTVLPWPTNRSLSCMEWRPGGAYGLIAGAGGTLLKWTGSTATPIETATEEQLIDVDWKADGTKALIVGNRTTVFLWDAVADDLTRLPFTGYQRLNGVAWDPAGGGALIVGDGGYVSYFNGTDLNRIDAGVTGYLYRVAWRPGATYAAVVGDSGVVLEVNATSVVTKVDLSVDWNLWRIAWAPDGSYALVTGQQYVGGLPQALVARYNASWTYQAIPVPGTPRAGLRGVQFSQSGESAIIVGDNSTALTWNGTALTAVNAPEDRTLQGVGWEGDASHALAVGNRGVLLEWNGTGWEFKSYDPRKDLMSVAWRPQGDYGMAVGPGGFMAKVMQGGSLEVDSGVTSDLYDVDFSSDGAFALACGAEGRVLRYDAATGLVTSIRTGILALHGISIKPGEETALAVGDAGQVWLWSGGIWLDKKPALVTTNLWDVAWRPDGAFAIIVGVSGVALNFTGGKTSTLDPQTNGYNNLYSVTWNRDGTAAMVVGTPIYTASDPSYKWYDGIEIYKGSDRWYIVSSHTNRTFWGCAFTSDGKTGVAFGTPDYVVKFSPTIGDGLRTTFRNTVTFLQRGAMSPTGNAVYFCGVGGYVFRMDMGQFENGPPILSVVKPKAGDHFLLGDPIQLDASGTIDPDSDPITFTWWSNVSGFLASGEAATVRIGVPGWHRITVYADDGHGHNVSQDVLVKLDIPNYPPVAVIESPLEGATYTTDDMIVFDANGSSDPNGDPMTYQWVSSTSGDVGYDKRIESKLPAGEHHIILWVDDGKGGRTAAFVNITVKVANRPPRVYITSPIEGSRFLPGTAVELNASYSSDPDLDPLAFTWRSDRDGLLGTGVVLRVTLSEGRHYVTVTADDGHGHAVTVGVNVTVARPQNQPPTLSVTSPTNSSQVQGVVTISGTSSDPDGTVAWVRIAVGGPEDWADVVGTTTWSYQWDTRHLPDGVYAVWVEASDGELATMMWVQYVVKNPIPPDSPPTVNLTTAVPASLHGRLLLEGTASDPDGVVVKVQVRMDGDAWVEASGTVAWSYYLDTTQYDDGPHTLAIRAWDGEKFSELVTRQFLIENKKPTDGGGAVSELVIVGGLLAAVVIVVAVTAVAIRSRRKEP
jgi:hypothetical protein